MADPRALIEALADTWHSLGSLADELSAEEWARPTGCPGWSVQDNVAHISGLELELMGRPVTDHQLGEHGLDHLRSEVGRHMEIPVDQRRSWTPERVLAEFHEVTAERLAQLRAMTDEQLGAEAPGPMGSRVPTGRMLGIRVFDCWAHEQDVRRAVARPGGLRGAAAEVSRGRMIAGVRAVVPKAVSDVDALVAFALTGPGSAAFGLRMAGGEGEIVDGLPEAPEVTLTMDLATFTALCCGRSDAGAFAVDGDADLAGRVIGALGFTP